MYTVDDFLSIIIDQAEQFVKNAEKCDGIEEPEVIQENPPGLLDFKITEPIDSVNGKKEFPLFSNHKVCEDVELKSTSQDASQLEQAEITVCPAENEIPEEELDLDKPNDEHSNLNELLLDLSEALDVDAVTEGESANLTIPSKTESSTLLDQSFTEDVVTQPLLSDIIQNGAFNPSHPDTLTDDELESYLAELEKEEEEEVSQPVTSQDDMGDDAHLHPSKDEPNGSPEIVAVDEGDEVSINDIVNGCGNPILPLIEEGETLQASDSEVTSAEESTESSFSDSDTAEVNSQLHEDSSASCEEEMPQLIDDPTLLNSANVAELIPSQATTEHNEAVAESDHHSCVETKQDDVPTTSELNESEAIVEVPPELVDTQEGASNTSSAVMGDSQGTGDDSLLEPYSSLTEDERLLGVLQPVWIPDEMAPQCMNCSQRFTGINKNCSCISSL